MIDSHGTHMKVGDLVYWCYNQYPENSLNRKYENVGQVMGENGSGMVFIQSFGVNPPKRIVKLTENLKKLTKGEAMLWKLENPDQKIKS